MRNTTCDSAIWGEIRETEMVRALWISLIALGLFICMAGFAVARNQKIAMNAESQVASQAAQAKIAPQLRGMPSDETVNVIVQFNKKRSATLSNWRSQHCTTASCETPWISAVNPSRSADNMV